MSSKKIGGKLRIFFFANDSNKADAYLLSICFLVEQFFNCMLFCFATFFFTHTQKRTCDIVLCSVFLPAFLPAFLICIFNLYF